MPAGGLSFVDKSTYPVRHFAAGDGVRLVPGGSSLRAGAYVARGVVCMPPMYINAGAWVDEGTMVDSHALVGSCAQIGKRVHLSAAAQIGGVLEPVNASPVVIEDDVLVGGNCGVYEGTIVRKGAVLAAGTILTRGTPLFDLVNGQILRATADLPLIVPENAVVVPGSRAVTKGKGHANAPSGTSRSTPPSSSNTATKKPTLAPLSKTCCARKSAASPPSWPPSQSVFLSLGLRLRAPPLQFHIPALVGHQLEVVIAQFTQVGFEKHPPAIPLSGEPGEHTLPGSRVHPAASNCPVHRNRTRFRNRN